jgi:hypothetical protein
MKARGGVFLDDEAPDLRCRDSILAARFGGFAEIALGLIRGKFAIRRHESSLASRYNFTQEYDLTSKRRTHGGEGD